MGIELHSVLMLGTDIPVEPNISQIIYCMKKLKKVKVREKAEFIK